MNKTHPNKSKHFEVTVTSIGVRGDGIANGVDERYFVPYSAPGDRLSITVKESRKGAQFAKIEKIITPSKSRTDPECPHFSTCGGCALQHVHTHAIASVKRGFLENALKNRNLPTDTLQPTVKIAPGLRRRVRFAVRKQKGVMLGFFEPRSKQIVNIEECPAVQPAIADLIDPLRNLIASIRAIGHAATVLVTASDSGVDMLLHPETESDLTLEDREAFAHFANTYDLARIAWHGPFGPEPVAQRREPRHRFGTVTVAPPLNAFLQPSKEGEDTIAATASRALHGAQRIADLYAGCGALTFPFSSIAPTHAFEGDAEMVAAIKRAAGNHPVTAHARDLARMPLTVPELNEFDAVVFDPPRAGAKSQAAALAGSSVRTIVAVSCNPGTLARDLSLLIDGGYTLQSVLPIDQFPWAPHVETVAVLRR
tara:strand:+ start:17 stop:1291 length:1275 start_codon:yes stop_codon:yes gene_type:complete